MYLLIRCLRDPHLRHPSSHHHHLQRRRLYDAAASVKCVRDRGLDHAVERERNLKPVLNLKNLIKSEPSKSLPLSLIAQSKESLKIPTRPIEFIRKYPSIFEEFLPGGIGVQPHIKLTPEVLNYDKEEQLIYQSVDYRQDVADRLLKLLMIRRINRIPLRIIDGLRWELGLPPDYVKTVVPEFPDYFTVRNGVDEEVLELVCWSNELAVSALEKKGKEPIEFTFKYSTGFEMDKKYKKWLDEWQKLPYISPYENALHLVAKSDDSDKWAVAVLHEILSLFVGSKGERENVLGFGEWLGLRSRFKRALLQHPGIFYVSSKIGTHTAVLKEAYNRGMLIKKLPLMDMRFKYVQLMNLVKEDKNLKSVQQKNSHNLKGDQGEEALEDDATSHEEDDGKMYDLSDDESDNLHEDNDDDVDDDDVYYARKNSNNSRGALPKKRYKEESPRAVLGRSSGRDSAANAGKSRENFHLKTEIHGRRSARGRSLERVDVPRSKTKSVSRKQKNSRSWNGDQGEEASRDKEEMNGLSDRESDTMHDDHDDDFDDVSVHYERKNSNNRGNLPNKKYKEKSPGVVLGRSTGRNSGANAGQSREKFYLGIEIHDRKSAHGRSRQRVDVRRSKNKSVSKKEKNSHNLKEIN